MPVAQLNIAKLIADPDDDLVSEFMDNIARVNQMGRESEGFVWMMEGSSEAGNTENYLNNDPRIIANLTLWRDLESLHAFTFNTDHSYFLKKRKSWFEHSNDANFVMYFVEDGHLPTLSQALERLEYLRQNGESDYAFGWKFSKKSNK